MGAQEREAQEKRAEFEAKNREAEQTVRSALQQLGSNLAAFIGMTCDFSVVNSLAVLHR